MQQTKIFVSTLLKSIVLLRPSARRKPSRDSSTRFFDSGFFSSNNFFIPNDMARKDDYNKFVGTKYVHQGIKTPTFIHYREPENPGVFTSQELRLHKLHFCVE
jgi:hypothetical protein